MERPQRTPPPSQPLPAARSLRGRSGRPAAGTRRTHLWLGALLLALPAAAAPAHPAQDGVRTDQVFVIDRRTGTARLVSGLVKRNGLDEVVLTVPGKDTETKYDSSLVTRIEWGDVPTSFQDGRTYAQRGEWEEAAAQFRLAAGDDQAREPVRAAARLGAAKALLQFGATEPAQFVEAATEAQRLVTDFPGDRNVPEARMLAARATLLAGNAAKAAADYKAIFAELQGGQPTPGYTNLLCLEAGVASGDAALLVTPKADTLAAREAYTAVDSAASNYIATLDESDEKRLRVAALRDRALLGEGFATLAGGDHRVASTFFQGKTAAGSNGSGATDALRFGALLGLAEAQLAAGKPREAQFNFARVSALDHATLDRVGRALVGLARCELELKDDGYAARAKKYVDAVLASYGATPAAAAARELSNKIR